MGDSTESTRESTNQGNGDIEGSHLDFSGDLSASFHSKEEGFSLDCLSIMCLSLLQGLTVTWADLKPVLLPPQPPESLDFRHMPPHSVPRSFRGGTFMGTSLPSDGTL